MRGRELGAMRIRGKHAELGGGRIAGAALHEEWSAATGSALVLFLVDQDAVRGTIQVVELTIPHRPEEGGETEQA